MIRFLFALSVLVLLNPAFARCEEVSPEFKSQLEKAETGNVDAQYFVADAYYNGTGVEEDNAKAVLWYEKCSDGGRSECAFQLGILYNNTPDDGGYSLEPDKAVRFFTIAAMKGHASAQYNLAVNLDEGNGVGVDHVQAVHWYSLSAAQGHAKSAYNLGHSYRDGEGVAADPTKALVFFRQASELGHARALYWLGFMLENGEAGPADKDAAITAYKRAAELQVEDAAARLKELGL